MTDLSKLSDDELMKLYQGKQQPQQPQDLAAMSDDALMKLYQGAQPVPAKNPSLGDFLLGDTSAGDYVRGRTEAVKSVFDPESWKQAGRELTSFPTIPEGQEPAEALKAAGDAMMADADPIGIALSVLPVTKITEGARSLIRPAKSAADIAKQTTLDSAAKGGFTVPRSNVKQTWWTNLGERFGGKQAIEATAQMKNQPITNKLAAKALGLSDDTPITPVLLKELRSKAGEAYEAMKSVGPLTADTQYAQALRNINSKYSGASKDFPELANDSVKKLVKALSKKNISAEGAVEQIKNLRNAANANRSFNSSPADKLLGKAQSKAADALDDLIGRTAEKNGMGGDILNNYKTARQIIAKTHTVEKALNPATGNIVGTELARQSKKGVPMTGELKIAADFARAFPRLARETSGAPASGGLFEPLVYGTAGTMATGGAGAGAAAIPIIGKPIARKLMTTIPKMSGDPRNEVLYRLLTGKTTSGAGTGNELARLLATQNNN